MTDAQSTQLVSTRAQAHPHCTFCNPTNPGWHALILHDDGQGGVQAAFPCPPESEGYPGLVHGGIASGLLDAAMTNALFSRGIAALTGRLTVRYLQPLRLGRAATVMAKATERHGTWWIVEGRITQDGLVAVSAEAWFKDGAARVIGGGAT